MFVAAGVDVRLRWTSITGRELCRRNLGDSIYELHHLPPGVLHRVVAGISEGSISGDVEVITEVHNASRADTALTVLAASGPRTCGHARNSSGDHLSTPAGCGSAAAALAPALRTRPAFPGSDRKDLRERNHGAARLHHHCSACAPW